MKRRILPYDASRMPFAKKLRSEMTLSEVKLWQVLKRGRLGGYDFDRQRPIGNYIVDFYCKDLQLAIEVDGITHEGEEARLRDQKRQEVLEGAGVSVLRFDALLVINDVEAAVKVIGEWIAGYEERNGVVESVRRKREGK